VLNLLVTTCSNGIDHSVPPTMTDVTTVRNLRILSFSGASPEICR
jgi:hypothetical protein